MSFKVKRIGNYSLNYKPNGLEVENHPVYLYRGYFIARSYYIANTPRTRHYEIYKCFQDGELSKFDFNINPEKGQNSLKDAVMNIDFYLEEKNICS
jgi:hypothetical protein